MKRSVFTCDLCEDVCRNVSVTLDHIRKGVQNNCHLCPVAIAIREAWPTPLKLTDVDVTINHVIITGVHDDAILGLPGPASQFIERFDKGQTVYPFEFDLVY